MEDRKTGKRPFEKQDEKVYKFKIFLPNGYNVGLTLNEPGEEMVMREFIDKIKLEYVKIRVAEPSKCIRMIEWNNKDLYLEDLLENKIRWAISFKRFQPHKCHSLRLYDGEKEAAESFENLWDLTPDTNLLRELPQEYTYETALADLIDNSLQAVWSNSPQERKLISVTLDEGRIEIFDSGPGMDGSDENSIVKWGKIGASLHRASRRQSIGGKPPYLMPFFGMFGYGGPIASMHLGRYTTVSSKRKESKRVCTLHLEREALLRNSGEGMNWKTAGGFRAPLEDEINSSPHGSFTKVEIFEPKLTCMDADQLKCRLKDIYFPYIQCDEVTRTRKTCRPVEFQVNGEDLAEVEGGEVAITNLNSCNGPEFVLQLRISTDHMSPAKSPGLRAAKEANARLKCVYFPIVEGKENIDRILEKVGAEGNLKEDFNNFCRVSVRSLGRLLPDARWAGLPFMESRKRGDKAQVLKRCCMRVKCFVDTDGGFDPTPSKTNLANHHPYTTALKNFGSKPLDKDKDIKVEILRGEKQLTLSQLEKEYEDWIFQMHERYDEEICCGQDDPTIVVLADNKKALGLSSDVVRVHKVIKRKGKAWKAGQHVKVSGGKNKKNFFGTIEYILIEGFQGDVGGECRLICRPLGRPESKGCLLKVNKGNTCLDVQESVSFPVSLIDSEKCCMVETADWKYQLDKLQQRAPSTIDILSHELCQQLEIEGGLPVEAHVSAGHATPRNIVAVIRPISFKSSSASKGLEQKFILKEDLTMSMDIKYIPEEKGFKDEKHIYSLCVRPSPCNGLHGLYIFQRGAKSQKRFEKSGFYKYSFSVTLPDMTEMKCEKRVSVKPCSTIASWGLISDKHLESYKVRVGSCLPQISVACYDMYDNQTPFTSNPGVMVQMNMNGIVLPIDKAKVELSLDNKTLQLLDILVESSELDRIRPEYKASLVISCSTDKSLNLTVPFQVLPGPLHHVEVCCPTLEKDLIPGDVIENLTLEIFDSYGNHVEKGHEVHVNVDGLSYQDSIGPKRQVDAHGCVNLDGILKVHGSYGRSVSFSVQFDGEVLVKREFSVCKRELRSRTKFSDYFTAGSQVENIVFEIVDPNGKVDESIHDDAKFGQSHTLIITSEKEIDDGPRYAFRRGRCTVPSISIPREPGIFSFKAAHSRYPELFVVIKGHTIQAPKSETSFTESGDMQFHSPAGQMILHNSPVSVSKHVELVESNLNDWKELQDGVCYAGLQIRELEDNLDVLHVKKATTEKEIHFLQESIKNLSNGKLDGSSDKENILKRIEEKDATAASVLCHISEDVQSQTLKFTRELVGVVALLGTVNNDKLSRALAEYLGEDNMLAIVCRSYSSAIALEKYEKSGAVDSNHALHAVASALGTSIEGRFLVVCLEGISPFAGKVSDDPQKKLVLENPVSPTGNVPPGFLGYAVNMINIDLQHLYTATAEGYGLRQTLFYLLFGELQVYETRENMCQARSCIKQGAISLDGGIMKANGVLSLGRCREPQVRFPVKRFEPQLEITPHITGLLEQVEDKKSELVTICDELRKTTKDHRKAMKSFSKRKDRLKKFMEEKLHLLAADCMAGNLLPGTPGQLFTGESSVGKSGGKSS